MMDRLASFRELTVDDWKRLKKNAYKEVASQEYPSDEDTVDIIQYWMNRDPPFKISTKRRTGEKWIRIECRLDDKIRSLMEMELLREELDKTTVAKKFKKARI